MEFTSPHEVTTQLFGFLRNPPQGGKLGMELKPSGQGEDLRLDISSAFPIPDRR